MASNPAIHVRLDKELLDRLRYEEKAQYLTRSAVVTIALNGYFERLDQERKKLGAPRGKSADRSAK